jgi:predicted DNA-binding transcriptional regulator AlpA
MSLWRPPRTAFCDTRSPDGTACTQADGRPSVPENPSAESLLIRSTNAAGLCGISRATWHRLRAAGKLGPEPIRLGRSVLYRRTEVESWAEAGCPDRATWRAMVAMDGRRDLSDARRGHRPPAAPLARVVTTLAGRCR